MRQTALTVMVVLGLGCVSAGRTIDGKIEGWSATSTTSPRRAVVWLEGPPILTVSNTRPVMAQRGGQFVPAFLVVAAGQTVEMPNLDDVAHNVYSVSDAKSFNLGYYAKGERKSVTFDRPGLVDTLCVLHNFMRAKILVVPNPYYAVVAGDGSFHIRNVPAGKFTLALWGEGLASSRQEVTIPAGSLRVTVSVHLPNSGSRK